ncbi:MAG: hypothetical protein A2X49_10120 [Lentisphaerae bacterium GWF2_52_8]|nr:MAG: hypothetical protein A2X49_10120 [Lentisphaerae bacterium GWF2_52_8]
MDVKNVNAFIEVMTSTFATALNAPPPFRCGDFTRLEGDIRNPDDLMCIITFSGSLHGTMLITFPEGTAKKVYAALMFEEPKELGKEVEEAFSEILNMIIGNVRAQLSTEKFNFDPPMVATGKKVKYENDEKLPWLLVPMAFEGWGKFNVMLSLRAG